MAIYCEYCPVAQELGVFSLSTHITGVLLVEVRDS